MVDRIVPSGYFSANTNSPSPGGRELEGGGEVGFTFTSTTEVMMLGIIA
jgi:hypothetical protein